MFLVWQYLLLPLSAFALFIGYAGVFVKGAFLALQNQILVSITWFLLLNSSHSSYRQNNDHEKCMGMGLYGFRPKKLNKKVL